MKFLFLGLVFLNHFYSCNTEIRLLDSSQNLLTEILNEKFQLYYDKSEIDKKLIKLFKKRKNFSLNMVNPGEEFNKTDIIIKNLPNKRLIFLGKSHSNLNIILFEEQSLHNNICFLYKKATFNKYIYSIIEVKNEIKTIEEIKQAISKNNYTLITNSEILSDN